MNSSDFTSIILVDAPAEKVFNAVNNVAGWWQGQVEGDTASEGSEFIYRMKDIHYSRQRLVSVIPYSKVEWLITDSQLSFLKQPGEWTGTKIVFDISPSGKQTQLRFTHMGLNPGIECYGACSNAWGRLVQESLFSLITTGKGTNVF